MSTAPIFTLPNGDWSSSTDKGYPLSAYGYHKIDKLVLLALKLNEVIEKLNELTEVEDKPHE